MSAFYDLASLVLVPSGYKASKVYAQKPLTTDGQLAFTRGTTATRVGPDGLIEKVRTNLVTYSNGFSNAAWAKSNFSLTSGQSDPFGGSNAWKAECTSTSGGILQTVAGSGIRVVSIYAKAGNVSTFSLWRGSAVGAGVSFDLANGTIISGVGTITSVGGGWYRCSTFGVAADVNPYFNTPTSGDFIYIAFSQLENGDVATDYIATTSAAVSVGPVANVPRLDYLNSTCPRLLLEPQRTNAILWSEQINTTNWPSSTQINVTANALVSPDGYQNADLIIPNTTNANHGPAQNVFGLTSGATYSCSIYAKAQGYNKFKILAGAGTGSGEYEFDLAAGTAQAGATITSVGNGWYRCTAPLVPNSSLLQYLIFISNGSAYSYAGNGTSGIAFWGAQVEAGAYATSYIPTLGAAVTRGADACSKTGISSLIGQTEGTLYWELDVKIPSATALEAIVNIDNGAGFGNTIYIYSTAAQIIAEMYVSSTNQASFSKGSITAGVYKCAFAYANNNTAFFVNGVQVGTTDTSCSVPATSRIQMGTTALSFDTSWTKQLLLFKTRLTNAQLAELTTI